ncbi:hypothetical protein J6S37_00175 [Candidatus Saccharibacteria bacterium]|nr:hypothetical protein [Candidatus Saccharibacteria bacterium]
MEYPKVVKAVFDPEVDRPGNSEILRSIFEIMHVTYDDATDKFTATYFRGKWGIAIEDRHDDEPEPHYYLEVGEGNYSIYKRRTYRTKYCDYYSEVVAEAGITEGPGEWRIHVWVASILDADLVAQEVSKAYKESMEKTLPDYCVLSSGETTFIK